MLSGQGQIPSVPPMARHLPTVVITGTSTGIGEAAALRLDRAGWQVFAGVRRDEDGRALAARSSSRLHWLRFDVTDRAAIEEAAARVAADVGEAGLDGLVNNAGIAGGGPVEFLSAEVFRRQLDVNLIGLLVVTQAFLPLLRRARGRIVNVGSISGRIASPMIAPYCASKHGVEALSDALRMELAPWGVDTIVIEPGVVVTPIWEKGSRGLDAAMESLPAKATELYATHLNAMRWMLERGKRRGVRPERVAAVIERALTARRPRPRYVIGADARLRLLLQMVLPRRWMDALVLRVIRRAGAAAS